MKIYIEMENKELVSYAELTNEMVPTISTSEIVKERTKNMSIVSKKFAVRNIRDEQNEIVITRMEIDSGLIIKIVHKLSPIIHACKMMWTMIVHLFEDIVDDLGDVNEWDIDIEGMEDDESDEEENDESKNTPVDEDSSCVSE